MARGRYLTEMTVSEWIKIPDHPRQRNTDRRAKYASTKHLAEYDESQSVVEAVEWPRGILTKLNGHTRACLWDMGSLPRPKGKLTVIVFRAESDQEFLALYERYDSRFAVKQNRDTLEGALREIGVDVKSSLLIRCGFTTQIRRAENDLKSPIYELVSKWKEQIVALDGLMLPDRFRFLVCIMLRAIRRDGIEKAGRFFRGIADETGTKDERGRDGIQAACEYLDQKRESRATGGWDNWNEIDLRVWSAYEQYLDSRRTKKPLRASPHLDLPQKEIREVESLPQCVEKKKFLFP